MKESDDVVPDNTPPLDQDVDDSVNVGMHEGSQTMAFKKVIEEVNTLVELHGKDKNYRNHEHLSIAPEALRKLEEAHALVPQGPHAPLQWSAPRTLPYLT
ncbi:unnamed protein product [Choristocarpus tenellus]